MLSEAAYGDIPRREASRMSKDAAEKALELDVNLAEGHAALGYNYLMEGDVLYAEKELKRAIALNPSYAMAHHYYSLILCFNKSLIDEAIEEVKRALELDPLSTIINVNLGRFLVYARRYDEAVEQLQKTLELDPNNFIACTWLGIVYVQKSMHEEAVAAYQRARKMNPIFGTDILLAYAYGMSGRVDEARSILNDLFEESETSDIWVGRWSLRVVAHLALGEKDLALEWLEKAFEKQEPDVAFAIKFGPYLDPIRDDPRFQKLLRRVNFPE